MISRGSFEYIQGVLAARAGIALEKGTDYVVESRLLPAAREYKIASVNELIRMMQSGTITNAEQILVEALSDKETSFFRDIRIFDALKKIILPELITKRASERKLSIWSMGCSTGQEAYSVALLLRENFPQLESWQVEVVGSDVSQEVLRMATAGRYNQLEINRGLPVALLVKYFQKDGLAWRLREDVAKSVRFFQMNVLDDWVVESEVDLILLRNVMGSFTTGTQEDIFSKAWQCMKSDGYLLLGFKETLPTSKACFDQTPLDKSVCYRPKPPSAELKKSASSAESAAAEAQRPPGQKWSGLAKLATGSGAMNLRGVTDVLSRDPDLSARFVKAMNRKPGRQPISTTALEPALKQTNKEQLLAISMATPATKALNEVFEAMTSVALEPVDPGAELPTGPGLTTGTAKFSGAFKGILIIRMYPAAALGLAGQALGLEPDDVGSDVLIAILTEMVTMIGGNFASALSAVDLACKLDGSEVVEKDRLTPEVPLQAGHEPLAFRHQDQMLWADIIITQAGRL